MIAGYDRANVQDKLNEVDDDVALVQVGWGLNPLSQHRSLAAASLIYLMRGRRAGNALTTDEPTPAASAATDPGSTQAPANPVEDLERLAALHASGALSDEQFEAAKTRLLEGS